MDAGASGVQARRTICLRQPTMTKSLDPAVMQARRFVQDARAELVQLRTAVAWAKEEVARAKVELADAKIALKRAGSQLGSSVTGVGPT
jgi:hypothetical protein